MIQALSQSPTFARWEPHIHAFVSVDDQAEGSAGPLAGVSVGVKDIIDVAGWPTRNGSAACAAASPVEKDAAIVAALRGAGAHIAGKTVTTEFAFIDPTDCRNPHDLARSPGGSSSGSGAAVAAGLVDLALGTQTAGSLCRPAAYCGVVGLKPGFGVLPMAGVTPMARSFDALGVITRSVDLAQRAFQAVTGQAPAQDLDEPRVLRGVFSGDAIATPDALQALDAAGASLQDQGAEVTDATLACDVDGIIAAHRLVMLAEAAQAHGHFLHPDTAPLLQPKFRACLVEGQSLSADQISEARAFLAQAREAFWQSLPDVDAVLTLPVPEGAPSIGDTTGFQGWLTPWTVFEGPLISLPWGLDRLGRPRAVMLATRPGTEIQLLALAARLEALAPETPRPQLPDPA